MSHVGHTALRIGLEMCRDFLKQVREPSGCISGHLHKGKLHVNEVSKSSRGFPGRNLRCLISLDDFC